LAFYKVLCLKPFLVIRATVYAISVNKNKTKDPTMKKMTSLLALIAASFMLVVGCASNDSAEKAEVQAATPAAEEAAPAPAAEETPAAEAPAAAAEEAPAAEAPAAEEAPAAPEGGEGGEGGEQ